MPRLPLSITHGSSLVVICSEVSRASAVTPLHYVERRGDSYRWSPAHRGGPYPLLRVTAKLLGVDYHELVLPCAPLSDSAAGFGPDGVWEGLCIVPSADRETPPDAWTVLELGEPATPDEVYRQLTGVLHLN